MKILIRKLNIFACLFFKRVKERGEWKVAIKTGISGCLGWILGVAFSQIFHRPDTLVSGLWSALAAIVVQQTHLGSTYRSAWMRFLGVLIGCSMGVFFTWLWGSNPLSLCLSITLTVVICSTCGLKESVRISCLSVAVIMILWSIRPAIHPLVFGTFRFLDSCLGILIAIAVANILWPASISKMIGLSLTQAFCNFKELYLKAVTFSSLNEQELLSFKKQARQTIDLIWKSQQYLEDSKLEILSLYSSLDDWKILFEHLDLLYERIISLSKIHKEQLGKMIDGELQQALSPMVQETATVLENFADVLNNQAAVYSLTDLTQAIINLELAQNHFRSKKITRQYDFENVEGLFVFFYSLRAISTELIKISRYLDTLFSISKS